MWNRGSNSRQTGSNEAPLGGARKWGGAGGGDGNNQSAPNYGGGGGGGGGGGYEDQRGGQGGYGGQQGGGGNQGGNYGQQQYDRDMRGGAGRYDDRGGGGRDDRGRSDARPNYDRPNMPAYQQRSPPRQEERRPSAWDAPSAQSGPPPSAPPSDVPGERKRKSRWGGEAQSGGMPTAITGGVDGKDLDSYAVQLRLDEIQRALRSGLVVPPDGSRSPSPPPTYDSHGRRTNTRDVRYRKKLEDERNRLVDRQVKNDPNFKPPTEYLMQKRQNGGRPTDKVYIPVKEFPEINFFGLLVGPRGNSLKGMERDSGAKISIRGKGSVKEGKGRPGGGFEDDENDELHCLITADTEEKVQRCVKLINNVIATAASVPEGQNDHKRSQLRELATLNGTLRDDENQVCQNCGGVGHRKYDCPEQKNWTAGIICRVCGGAGHMARDCTQKTGRPGYGAPPGQPGFPGPGAPMDQARTQQFDSEYAALMSELGETSTVPPLAGGGPGMQQGGQGGAPWSGGASDGAPLDDNGEKIPPWRIASNWHPPGQGNRGPPQGQQGGYGQQQYGAGQQAYTGTSQGYSSFPAANQSAAQYGSYQQQAPPGGGYGQYPQQ